MSEQDEAQAAILGCLAWRLEQKRAAQRASNRAARQRRKEREERYEWYGLAMLVAMGFVWGSKFPGILEGKGVPKPTPKTVSAEAFDRLWRE